MNSETPPARPAHSGRGLYSKAQDLLYRHRHMNWAMLDQGMVSGFNFITGLILARYLGLAEFGRFTLAWMTIEFLLTFQQCLIVAPMMSIGPKTDPTQQRKYFGAVLAQQGLFAVASLLLFFGCIMVAHSLQPDWTLGEMILPLLVAGFAVQFQNYFRRYLFTNNRGKFAFLIDLIRYPGQAAVLLALMLTTSLDATDALWIYAATSGAAAVIGALLLDRVEWEYDLFLTTLRRHWQFAKWFLLSEIMRWGTINLFFAVAGAVLGTVAVGAIRAAQLVLGFCNILIFGIENFAIVRASQHYREGGATALLTYIKRLTFYGGLLVGAIALIAAVAPGFWLSLIKSEYMDYGYIVVWWSALHLVLFVGTPLDFGLRTIERTRTIFWASLGSAIVSVISVYPLISYFGITGAMAGILLIQIVKLLLLILGFRLSLTEVMAKPAA